MQNMTINSAVVVTIKSQKHVKQLQLTMRLFVFAMHKMNNTLLGTPACTAVSPAMYFTARIA
jgi:hypothetical protein